MGWAQAAMAAASVAGGVLGAAADRQAGKNAELEGEVSKKILDFNAAQVEATAKQESIFAIEQAEIEARSRIEVSQIEEERVARKGEIISAGQRASFAKGGVTIEGSPLDFLAETAGEIIEERALTLRQGLVESGRLKAQASIFSSTSLARANADAAILRQQGEQAARLGKAENKASRLRAANRLLSAGGGAASSFGGGQQTTQNQRFLASNQQGPPNPR
jgi:hypothetical protein